MGRHMEQALYAWQEQEPGGRWGTIAAFIPGMGTTSPLVFRTHQSALLVRAVAKAHQRASGNRVELRVFKFAGTVEIL